jgi:hypothetical protein
MTTTKLALLFTTLMSFWAAIPAQAQLVVSPTRVVFEGSMRTTQLDIINTTGQRAIYRLALVKRRMTENGENVPAAEPVLPGERFVDEMVRFTPRQLVLEPGASQVVRLSLRKPPGLEAGEYRSHLHLERVADADQLSSLEAATDPATAGQGMQIRLTALIGALIPVIVREGAPKANLTIHDLQLVRGSAGEPLLSLALKREGNRSVYGDIVVSRLAEGSGQPVEISRLSGIAVYVPNDVLRLRLPLPPGEGTNPQVAKLRVTFQLKSEEGSGLLAQADLAPR